MLYLLEPPGLQGRTSRALSLSQVPLPTDATCFHIHMTPGPAASTCRSCSEQLLDVLLRYIKGVLGCLEVGPALILFGRAA